jgi:hypothetical protein
MNGALMLLVCASGLARGDSLQQAIELLKTGDARAALTAAESESDARARAQARVYVLHQAGDLEAALAVAHSESDAWPNDPWLAQKWAFVAATLRRSDASSSAASRLERAVIDLPAADREAWQDAVRTAKADASELMSARARRIRAERVARAVSLTALASAIVALTMLALWPSRRQRMSSTPVDPIGSNKVAGGSQ